MTTLRRVLSSCILCCCPLLAQGQQKVNVGHAASASVSVRLIAAVASVRVIGWDRDSIEMTGVVAAGSRVEMGYGAPANAPRGIKGYIETPTEQGYKEGRITLRVPRDARVWLKTGSADIDVSGVTGGLDLNVVGGAITVHGTVRELRAESMDGNVTVDGVAEWARLKTATGDISIKGGTDLGASTISGTIRASGGDIERAKLETTTGMLVFASGLALNPSIELESHSGSIEIALPRKIDLEIEAATIAGTIDNQWTKTPPSPGHEGRGATLQTRSGMGGGRMVVRSFKGAIVVKAR